MASEETGLQSPGDSILLMGSLEPVPVFDFASPGHAFATAASSSSLSSFHPFGESSRRSLSMSPESYAAHPQSTRDVATLAAEAMDVLSQASIQRHQSTSSHFGSSSAASPSRVLNTTLSPQSMTVEQANRKRKYVRRKTPDNPKAKLAGRMVPSATFASQRTPLTDGQTALSSADSTSHNKKSRHLSTSSGASVDETQVKMAKKSFVPHTCDTCKVSRSRQEYSVSQWKNRHLRSTTCNVCFEKRGLFTCKGGCNRTLDETEFNASQWKHRGDPSRMTMCKQCSQGFATFFCNGPCERWLTENDFDPSQWKNRFNISRQTFCKDCLTSRRQLRHHHRGGRGLGHNESAASPVSSDSDAPAVGVTDAESKDLVETSKGLRDLVKAALTDV